MKKCLVLLVAVLLLFGCATAHNKTEAGTRKGVAIGTAVGAILGQVLGGDTKATLIGAGVGALIGGIAGHSYGKQADKQEAALRKQLAAIEEANVQRNADILAITFGSDMLFDSGSAQLKPGAYEQIRHVSKVLTQYTDTAIRIVGHTDSTGSETFNQQLSEHRATKVKLAIVEQGVHPSRIETIGLGASAPLANNDTKQGRKLNRRVVITISPREA
jgi:outer membrane protein OmpA-like peptidoglycan-associated protein